MTRTEETKLLRFLQEASRDELENYLSLQKKEPKADLVLFEFEVTAQDDQGFLHFTVNPIDGNITWAEMNVNFPTMIGLNRSPLELRIVCEHVFDLYA